jgi:phosphoribosylanthranilate isomerase
MPVRVKICGITNAADAHAAFALGADAIGLNFYPGSPRAVTSAGAREIIAGLPRGACVVGVFVNAPRRHISAVAGEVGLSAIQFHGDEPPEDCLDWGDLLVIKALPAEGPEPLATRAGRYPMAFLLVDAPSAVYGGTGCTFDWSTAAELPRSRLVVAGGLTAENVAAAVHMLRPVAVDVASGVERSPGIKDHEKLKAFIGAAKTA